MVYVGNKTYKSIKIANQHFLEALHPFQATVVPVRINKSHIPMVLQYAWPCSKRFEEIGAFMAKTKLK